MASANVGRIFALNILLAITCVINAQGVPPVTLQAFKPKGFHAFIDDTPNLDVFVFHGNVNNPIQLNDVGTLAGEAHRATDGKWIVEDTQTQLKVGDVINYYVFVSFETAGYLNKNLNYLNENQTFTIAELEDLNLAPTETGTIAQNSSECGDTLTKIYGGRTACAGQTIFEDNFDTLRENLWQIEQYIPIHHNEIPFVSYQRLLTNPTVTTINGSLRIAPTLQENVPGYSEDTITSGKINLFSGCTAEVDACSKTAQGADILPPIVSGRITSKGFAFRYGTIHVRAKLPLGDWLYPEILLEPLLKNRFGNTRYASGVLKIACVRGNTDTESNTLVFGGRVLYGGPIMDFACRSTLLNNLPPIRKRWGDEYHVYSARWDQDRITLSVDGVEWGRVEPDASGLVGKFPKDECKDLQRELLGYRSKLAPFDDYFYIALGVAAGGITEFPDDIYPSTIRTKPWTNAGRKAMLQFWQDMHNWITTWDRPELLVDYVKVDAL